MADPGGRGTVLAGLDQLRVLLVDESQSEFQDVGRLLAGGAARYRLGWAARLEQGLHLATYGRYDAVVVHHRIRG